jgi:hypothetical protein
MSNTTKSGMQEWLVQWNIPFTPSLLCPELDMLIEEHKPHCCTYHIIQMFTEHGHTVLHLSPYHLDLNPKEVTWATVKGCTVAKITTFKLDDKIHLMKERFVSITLGNWSPICCHITEDEAKY